MEIASPPNTKKSGKVIQKLKKDLELRKLNCEWQEDFEGLFGLLKQNYLEDKNKNGNWVHRTVSLWCNSISSNDRRIISSDEKQTFEFFQIPDSS